ncbi:hypothetical protein CFIMG_008246RA00001 [Ceratocystis fimbriata CBS 114723]|uniref:Uncharacterized protein n=1 Tax=Ceratocystis fimbriata CBS 114723 TaxID=1035309 RepID=A0A2C5X634_9PEZI|nr:hypothetical protein CFIMG_008246RA00001 [Ceratocystis fimbriata CBS 114723]
MALGDVGAALTRQPWLVMFNRLFMRAIPEHHTAIVGMNGMDECWCLGEEGYERADNSYCD